MNDPLFRQWQLDHRYDPHITSINRLVDALCHEAGARMPYVAPHYGGIEAEVLFIFQDPGGGTDESREGSGFLCAENADPSAELFSECLDQVGLAPNRMITWNASPWLRAKPRSRPSVGELEAGVEPTMRLLSLLQKLEIVMLMGSVARDGWERLCLRHPSVRTRYHVIRSLHTSPLGITNGSQHSKAEGVGKVIASMREALAMIDPPRLRGESPSPR